MTKTELQNYRHIVQRIRQLKAEREELIRLVKAPDGMPKGGEKTDPTADAGGRLADIAAEIDDELTKLREERSRITAVLSTLPPKERNLMYYHYILGLSWEKVAVEMHFNYRWVMRLHIRALRRIAEK